jgi:hypothetical protein
MGGLDLDPETCDLADSFITPTSCISYLKSEAAECRAFR